MLRDETLSVQDISGDSDVAISAGLPEGVTEMLDDAYAAQQCDLSEAELDELWAAEQHRRDTERLVTISQLAAVAMTISVIENRRSAK